MGVTSECHTCIYDVSDEPLEFEVLPPVDDTVATHLEGLLSTTALEEHTLIDDIGQVRSRALVQHKIKFSEMNPETRSELAVAAALRSLLDGTEMRADTLQNITSLSLDIISEIPDLFSPIGPNILTGNIITRVPFPAL